MENAQFVNFLQNQKLPRLSLPISRILLPIRQQAQKLPTKAKLLQQLVQQLPKNLVKM